MMKLYISLVFCVLLISAPGYTEEPSMEIVNLKVLKKQLVISFIIHNNTDLPLWFCQDVDNKGKQDYVIEVDRIKKIARIKFTSVVVPPHVLLEEPIWGEYTKIEPKAHLNKTVKLALPLTATNRFSEEKLTGKKSIAYIEKLILEVGYYDNKIVNLKETCCRNDSDEIMVLVSCFWAEKNKEYIMITHTDHLKIPFYLRAGL